MKAIVWTAYGPPDVLKLQDMPKPTPKDNEILIKIHATTVTAGDCEMRRLDFPYWVRLPMRIFVGFWKPQRIKIPGLYLAGEVEETGSAVSRFQKGDQLFGLAGLRMGTYAEYVCVPEKGALATKPANMTFGEAAPVALGGLEALHFLRKANLQPGEKVLINGAAGSIGTYGIQLAHYFGAHVTAVDSTDKLDTLRATGADKVIDYTQADFTQLGDTYDVIFDVIGKSSFSRSVRILNPHGRYLIANPSGLIQRMRGEWVSARSSKSVIFEMTSHRAADLDFLRTLIEAGDLKTVMGRQFPLAQMADAHRHVESGQKVGNVIITVDHPNQR